jgi:hypothetical protein
MLIPLYTIDGSLDRYASPGDLTGMAGIRIIRNRRGNPMRAYRGGQSPQRPIAQGNAGSTYEEHLPAGPVWSMVLPARSRAA